MASALVESLLVPDRRLAQFALDSLRLIRADTIAYLVCHLEDARRLGTRDLYWLNLTPHVELFAHHSPRTVSDAILLLIGPSGVPNDPCVREEGDPASRMECVRAWRKRLGNDEEQ